MNLIDFIGSKTISWSNKVGSAVVFLLRTIIAFFSTKLKLKKTISQMEKIGVGSFSIVFLTGVSSGLALALQTYVGLSRFGGEDFIGIVVAIGMTRELSPVLTGLMVMARSGSAMAAEVGTMRISEQIDALKTLDINPFQYLIVPRLVAGTFILPFLTAISMTCGIIGSYFYATHILGINSEQYISNVQANVELSDITGGLVKSSIFGLIITWIGSFFGYNASGGARGVGAATTQSVVAGSILILMANYFLSSIMFGTS